MRIIAGKFKRTPIKTLDGDDITRPTKDMVKEALFSSIQIYEDTSFLDLFSGSGSIGLEAISRGSNDVIFNDSNIKAYRIIKENLDHLDLKNDVYNLDYADLLNRINKSFDFIYCDPPYRFNNYEDLFYLVSKNKLLNKKGIMILEVNKDTILNQEYLNIRLFKEKKYGICKLLYYKNGD